MKTVLGYIFGKLNIPCSSRYSKEFCDGWFLGAGLLVRDWSYFTNGFDWFGRRDVVFFIMIVTRKSWKYGYHSYGGLHKKNVKFLSFGYMVFGFSYYKKNK
jgi:hypothetical protein